MIETYFDQDVMKPVKVRYLDGNVFSLDNNGNKVGVRLYNNGSQVNVSGSVSASVIRADGATVAVTGSSSGNLASVILPQSALAVPGVLSIVIKVTSGSDIMTVGAIVANVYQSSTDSTVDPGTIIPSIDALIAEIDAAVASIPLDYSELSAEVVALANVVITDFDINAVSLDNFNISPTTGKWASSSTYESFYFRKPNNAKIFRIKANANNNSAYAFLAASDTHTAGDYPVYATGCTRTTVSPGTTADAAIPEDCAFIWISKTSSFDAMPQYVGFNADIISAVDTVTNISEYGKNKYDGESGFTFTKTQTVYLKTPIPAGTYTFSAVATSPTSTGYSRVYINDAGSVYFAITKDGERNSSTLTVSVPITHLRFYSSTTGTASEGMTATYSNIQIEAGSNATSYEPYLLSAVDNVARGKVDALYASDIVMCYEMILVDDLPINFYLQNVLRWQDAHKIQRIVFRTFQNMDVIMGLNIAKLITNPEQNSQVGYLRVYPATMSAYVEKTLRCRFVRPTAGSGLTKKVMIIGDSLTWNGPMLSKLMDMFENDVMHIQSVGTIHTSGNNNGYYHEGRSGWSSYTYTHVSSRETSWGTVVNAFYNPSTQTFDFAYYVSTTGIIPDYVMLCIGTNDIGRTDIVENFTAIINSIHSYSANIKIGLWMPPAQALYANNILNDFFAGQDVSAQLVAAFDNMQSNNVYIVPALYVLDVEHDFPSVAEQYDKFNTSLTYAKNTDRLHPLDSGYYKLAELLYGYIKYFGSLDQQ